MSIGSSSERASWRFHPMAPELGSLTGGPSRSGRREQQVKPPTPVPHRGHGRSRRRVAPGDRSELSEDRRDQVIAGRSAAAEGCAMTDGLRCVLWASCTARGSFATCGEDVGTPPSLPVAPPPHGSGLREPTTLPIAAPSTIAWLTSPPATEAAWAASPTSTTLPFPQCGSGSIVAKRRGAGPLLRELPWA